MKIFLLFLLFLVVAYSSDKCDMFEWASKDQPCDSDHICYDNLMCVNGKCKEDNTGEECTQNEECYYQLCFKNKCTGKLDNGEQCSEDILCLSGNCKSGVCYGSDLGESCDPKKTARSCKKGLFCSSHTGKCIEQIEGGVRCDLDVNATNSDFFIGCEPGYTCDQDADPITSTCRKINSGKVDEHCGSEKICELGLHCVDHKCVSEIEFCDSTGNNECGSGYYCKCMNANTGKCEKIENTGCNDEFNNELQCYAEHQCNLDTDMIPDSCVYENCKLPVESSQCCKFQDYSSTYFPELGVNCNEPTCDYMSYGKFDDKCDSKNSCLKNLFCPNMTQSGDHFCSKENYGATCSVNEECSSNICYQNKCVPSVGLKSECTNNEQCTTKDCDQGVCKGSQENESCDKYVGHRQCGEGLFCDWDTSKCTPQIKTGKDCSQYNDAQYYAFNYVCETGSRCNIYAPDYDKGVCVKFWSQEKGENCYGDNVCQDNLKCWEGTCQVKVLEWCNDDKYSCNSASNCDCNDGFIGTCNEVENTECNDEKVILNDCLNNEECEIGENYADGTCTKTKCSDEFKNLQCCLIANDHSSDYYLPAGITCTTSTPTPTSTPKKSSPTPKSSSLSLQLGLGIGIPAGLIILAAIIFIVVRKNRSSGAGGISEGLLDEEDEDSDM
ncbi:dd-gdca protein [Anaeramoeba flamelloides]|uniref:Dd-gdca protein n=1 Tax=Anaeramoeba flamelloides TaxID=1746091 RepID=A0ABQ8XVQ5_9EUKA|nr:dd-gdca protein [Anaeramoeba flamelloides]